MNKPKIIPFDKIGNSVEGYISIAQNEKSIPFYLKRVFWTYYTPEEIVRGKHAHYETEMILVAVAGIIVVETECLNGEKNTFVLDKPNVGLYIPKLVWHTMQYQHNSVQLCMTNSIFNEDDYIRDYKTFSNLKNTLNEV
jgi:hypothetical protein